MSDTWNVQLVYTDDRSNKFWRARTEGSTMYVNYGRVGTDGQTQVKLELAPGSHQLQLVLGDHLHIPHEPPVLSEAITIEVVAGE